MSSDQVAQPAIVAQMDQQRIKTMRAVSMVAVQQAKSGHPGTPMALAPLKKRQRKLGFEPERVVEAARELVGKAVA